jgi:hypothetical protein
MLLVLALNAIDFGIDFGDKLPWVVRNLGD